MATPSYTRGQVESVVQVPDIDDSWRQLMRELDASMPDFADLLGVEPRTPSPMKDLMGIVAVCPVFPLNTSVLLISGVPVWLPAPSDRGEMMLTLAGTGSSDSSE
jgi:hypothetical protein